MTKYEQAILGSHKLRTQTKLGRDLSLKCNAIGQVIEKEKPKFDLAKWLLNEPQ